MHDACETDDAHAPSAAERWTGPVTSLALHAIMITLLAVFAGRLISESDQPDEDSQVTLRQPEPKQELDPELPPLEPVDPLEDPSDLPPNPTLFADRSTAPIISETTAMDPALVEITQLSLVAPTESPVVLKNLFANRTPAGRKATQNRFGSPSGGGPRVKAGLNWLARNQIKEGPLAGTWPTRGGAESAMAGLGLLAFLAHGELPSSSRYGDTVRRSIDYLIRTQRSDGLWQHRDSHNYAHAIATYAVSEAYAMTHHPSLGQSMELAIAHIVDGVIIETLPPRGSMRAVPGLDSGGNTVSCGFWNYNYADGAWTLSGSEPTLRRGVRKDHSFAGFQLQALKAAMIAESRHPRLATAIQLGLNGVKAMQARDGGFAYSATTDLSPRGAGSANQLGVGAYVLALMRDGRSPESQRARERLAREAFDPTSNHAFYRIYYEANAMFQADAATLGPLWDRCRTQHLPWLIETQLDDGSWSAETATNGVDSYDRVYPTCLAILSLEVPSRYLLSSTLEPQPPASGPTLPDIEVKEFRFDELL